MFLPGQAASPRFIFVGSIQFHGYPATDDTCTLRRLESQTYERHPGRHFDFCAAVIRSSRVRCLTWRAPHGDK